VDGKPGTMVFVSRQTGQNEIYTTNVNAAGTGSSPARLVPADTYPEDYPDWSPDGKRLDHLHAPASAARAWPAGTDDRH